MNHRTPTRSKRTETDKRICGYGLNKTTASEVHETCVYEIDIRSSIDFLEKKPIESPSVKVCVANVSPLTLEKKSNCKDNTYKIVENQLIHSHYPRFRETDSETECRPPSATAKANLLNASPDTPENTKNTDANCSPTKQTLLEKSHVETQSPSSDCQIKKKIKKQIIKGLLGKTESLLSRRDEFTRDKELVHLHHHEHHHHYHIGSRCRKEDGSSYPSKGTNTESQDNADGKRNSTKFKADDVQSTHPFFCVDNKSNIPAAKSYRCEQDDRKDVDKFVTKNFKGCRHSKTTRMRNSSSIESLSSNKPNLFKTHSYSDTELVRCDSEDIIRCDVIRMKDSNTNYTELVRSLKSLNAFTPTVVTDQMTKISVQHMYPEKKSSVSTMSYTVPDKATEISSENKVNSVRIENRDPGSGPYVVRKYQNGRLDSIPLQTWTKKIKTELREIKRELKLIERRYLKEKTTNSTAVTQFVSSSMDSRTEDESGNEVSVFSSKTFILRAENFYIIEESESGVFSEDIEQFFDNDELCYAETDTGRFLVSPNGSWLHFKKDETPKMKITRATKPPEVGPMDTVNEPKESENKAKRYFVLCNDSVLRRSE